VLPGIQRHRGAQTPLAYQVLTPKLHTVDLIHEQSPGFDLCIRIFFVTVLSKSFQIAYSNKYE